MLRPLISIAACLVACSAFAEDMPSRKPGLWEVKMSFDGRSMPPRTVQQCIDKATDEAMRQPPGQEGGTRQCSKPDVKRSGDTMTVDIDCTADGHTSQTHMAITGSFDSGYTMKMSFKGDRSPEGMSMTMDAKWLGACKADQKPGDMIMPGGMKININDMKININDMKNMHRGGVAPGVPQR